MNNPNLAFLLKLTPADIQGLTRDQVIQRAGLALTLTPEERQKCQWQLALLKGRRILLQLSQTHAATQKQAGQLRKIIADRDQTIADCNRIIADRNQAIFNRDGAINNRDLTINRLDQAINLRDQAISQRDQANEGLYKTITNQNQTIADLNQQVDRGNQTILNRDQTIAQRDLTIVNLQNQRNCWQCFLLEKSRGVQLVITLFWTIFVSMLIIGLAAVETQKQKQSRTNSLWGVGSIGLVTIILLIIWFVTRQKSLQHPHN